MRRQVVLILLMAGAALAWVAGSADAQAGVVIDEVMARNNSTLIDADGDTPDWIELVNNNGASVQLAGWTIADDSLSWPIPTVTIPANGRLVIFASDKDRTSPDLHTNFKLSSAGEIITLRNGSGTVIDQLGFGTLGADESWGRAPNGLVGPLLAPTPGQPNSGAQPPAVVATTSQTFVGSITVVLSTNRAAAIHYTLDGTTPTAASPRYGVPLTLTATTALRTTAVEAGGSTTGPESTEVYTRIDSRLAGQTSNVPIVVMTTQGTNLRNTTPVTVSITEPGSAAGGRTALGGPATTVSLGSARIRGLSSADFPKKQYRVELWDGWDTQNDTDVDLIGMGAESDWVLYAPGRFDRAHIQNPLMQRLHGDLGLTSLDTRFVEVYLDDNGDGIAGLGEYEGLFVLMESIKVADERIDVGGDGYVFAIDWFDSCCADLQVSPAFSQLKIVDPGIEELTPAQIDAAEEWFDAFDDARQLPFAAPGGVTEFIDVQSFIDVSLLQVLSGNIDRYRASNYMYIDDLSGGLLTGGPGWDFDRSLNSDDVRDDLCGSFNGPAADAFTWWWWGDLWAMPDYQSQLRARWADLRTSTLRSDVLWQTIDAMGAGISEAWERDNTRWESTDGYGSRHGGLEFELEATKGWLACRLDFMDAELSTPTCFGLAVTVNIGAGQIPTPGNDVILGTAGDDLIGAGDGDDIICGGGGDDQLFGQNGDDLIFGGAGDDKLRGGDGNDELRGGDGADDANGGRDDDRVFGGPGADTAVRGGTGDDLVDGGAGDDLLVAGNGGSDVVTGGPGDDRLVTGGPRPDVVRGGDGNDFVRGLGGADLLLGDQGNDDLRGGRQPDTIDGGPGIDVCNGGTTGNGAIESDEALPTCEGSPINFP